MITAIKLYASSAWGFLLPFLKIFLSQAGQVLASVAMNTVKNVALNYASEPGDKKRVIAFDHIQNELANQGIKIGASVINAAIEAAVQRLK